MLLGVIANSLQLLNWQWAGNKKIDPPEPILPPRHKKPGPEKTEWTGKAVPIEEMNQLLGWGTKE